MTLFNIWVEVVQEMWSRRPGWEFITRPLRSPAPAAASHIPSQTRNWAPSSAYIPALHYNVRYPVLRWRPLLMRCQSLDNLLQQLDPHLLPLTFLFPSQDSLLMQRKLSPTYLFADRPVCKAAVSRRRCAPPQLKCDVGRPVEMLICDCLVAYRVISTVGLLFDTLSFIFIPVSLSYHGSSLPNCHRVCFTQNDDRTQRLKHVSQVIWELGDTYTVWTDS